MTRPQLIVLINMLQTGQTPEQLGPIVAGLPQETIDNLVLALSIWEASNDDLRERP